MANREVFDIRKAGVAPDARQARSLLVADAVPAGSDKGKHSEKSSKTESTEKPKGTTDGAINGPKKPDLEAVDQKDTSNDQPKEDPNTTKIREELAARLKDKSISAEEKIKAIKLAAKNGIKSLSIADRDGKMREYTLETSPIDKKRGYVHLFSKDDSGKRHIVLRAITDENGDKPEKQRNPKGEFVTHEGTWWSKNMAARSGIPMPEQKEPTKRIEAPSRPDVDGQDVPKKPKEKSDGKPENGKYKVEVVPKPGQSPTTGAVIEGVRDGSKIDDRNKVVVKGDETAVLKGDERVVGTTESVAGTTDRTGTDGDRLRPQVFVRPGESIQKAIERAPENAVINVAEGVYNERLNISRNNIKLKGHGKAVLDMGGRALNGAVINISGRRNITVDGFEIRNARGGDTPTAIRIDGDSSDISIVNNNIHHIESSQNAHGIGVFGTRRTPLKNVTIENNKVHNLKLGQSEAVVINGNVDGFKIVGNEIRDTDNIGIDIIGGEGTGPAGSDRARNGLIARNKLANIDSRKNPTYRRASAAAIYVDGGAAIKIEDNQVSNSNYGIELASEHAGKFTERIELKRNRIDGSHLAAISLGAGEKNLGGARHIDMEGNTGTKNARAIWYQYNVDRATVTDRNNLFN